MENIEAVTELLGTSNPGSGVRDNSRLPKKAFGQRQGAVLSRTAIAAALPG